jgi:hypothetical protein
MTHAVRNIAASVTLFFMLALTVGTAHAQMPGMGGPGGLNIGGGRGHGGDADRGSPSCPPGSIDYIEDARDRLQTLRSKINPSTEQIALWNRYDVAASRAIEDQKRWHNRDHRQDSNRPVLELDRVLLDELRDRTAALEDIEDAAKPLYASLSAEQKDLASKEMPAILSDLAGNQVMQFERP